MKRVSFALLMGAVLAGCSSISLETEHDPSASFEGRKSFAWLVGPRETGDARVDDPTVQARIKETIETALAEQGYKGTTAEKADFFVSYKARINQEIETWQTTMNLPYGWRSAMGPRKTVTAVHEVEEGTLILDIVDPASRNLIWRGIASAAIDRRKSPEERRARLRRAVSMLLDRFPPR